MSTVSESDFQCTVMLKKSHNLNNEHVFMRPNSPLGFYMLNRSCEPLTDTERKCIERGLSQSPRLGWGLQKWVQGVPVGLD